MILRTSGPELYCRETMTRVQDNRMRPGYDCRCSGCMAYVETMRRERGVDITRLADHRG